MTQYVWLIPFLPLLSWAIIGIFNRKLSATVTTWMACGSVLISFFIALDIFFEKVRNPISETVHLFNWIRVGDFVASFDCKVDPLTSIFLIIITGVGFLIHEYSSGYMHDDEGYRRFFAYLNLFVFFMLVLVLADNFLTMFIGWEGVGLCSYLLISFWYKNIDYAAAAKKAFIMNRIGDLGLILGIILVYSVTGTIRYDEVFNPETLSKFTTTTATAATLLFFIGAMGKSAQIPLFTWLPDAMAGPTPVSALIHAATMVTAGIYLIARSSSLFALAPFTNDLILWIGLATSLISAIIAIYQNDIKKVLAYSTVSQLGLMFAALGVGAYSAAVFHVATHAFFKALLFLGAGSVIHGLSGEQDIRNMGGIKKLMPTTYITFLIGTIAISGIPPFAAFFSKDQILGSLMEQKGIGVYVIGVLISLMTCFYMFRLFFLVFSGSFRGTSDQEHHAHESPASMTVPLIILAIFSAIAGFVGVPHFIGDALHLPNFLNHFLESSVGVTEESKFQSREELLAGVLTVFLIAVTFIARGIYTNSKSVPGTDSSFSGFPKLAYNKFYFDEIYDALITKPLNALSVFTNKFIENRIIDGFVDDIKAITTRFSSSLRLVQQGKVDGYFFGMVAFIILIFLLKIL